MQLRLLAGLLVFLCCAGVMPAQGAELDVPAAAQWSPQFDVAKATDAWINTLPADKRAKSDAYFEGGYWLQLWDLLWSLAIAAILLTGRRAARLRDWCEQRTSKPWLQIMLFAAVFLLLSWLLGLPLEIYQSWYREHQYDLSNQTFLEWFNEQLIGHAVDTVFDSLFILALYAALRRAGARWWVWATGITTVFTLIAVALGPVFIAPLFNKYQRLPEGPVRESIVSLARANQIPSDNIYWFDASKQTDRISANVSGALGTMRISLNDNLLKRTNLHEIRAVMAHEMGHYVLNHVWRFVIYYFLLWLGVLYVVHRLYDRFLAGRGQQFGIRDRGDVAGLPAAIAIVTLLMFVITPLRNTITRQAESEADMFGLNAAREAQGFASTAMKLSTYRKISPSPLEEILFYDHPSGRTRIQMSMQWLKENPPAATTSGSAP